MLAFTFWKISLEGKAFTLIGVPPMAVVVVVIITGRVVAVVMAVMAAAVVMAPGKGSGENPEKSSPRREGGLSLGLPIQKGARVRVIKVPFNALPAQKER